MHVIRSGFLLLCNRYVWLCKRSRMFHAYVIGHVIGQYIITSVYPLYRGTVKRSVRSVLYVRMASYVDGRICRQTLVLTIPTLIKLYLNSKC